MSDDLAEDGQTWNRTIVQEMFTQDDAADILQIPVGGAGYGGLHGMELHS